VEKLTFGTKAAAEGKPAPDLALEGADGKPIPLSKLRGGAVLLYFGIDDRDLPVLEWMHRALEGKGLTVINVAPDSRYVPPRDTRLYSMRQASDRGGLVAKALGVSYQGIVLLDGSGTVLVVDSGSNWQRIATELQRLHVW
jgi:hypothetical protein